MNAVNQLKAWFFGQGEWSLSALISCAKYTAWVALIQKSFAHSMSADGMIAAGDMFGSFRSLDRNLKQRALMRNNLVSDE